MGDRKAQRLNILLILTRVGNITLLLLERDKTPVFQRLNKGLVPSAKCFTCKCVIVLSCVFYLAYISYTVFLSVWFNLYCISVVF